MPREMTEVRKEREEGVEVGGGGEGGRQAVRARDRQTGKAITGIFSSLND